MQRFGQIIHLDPDRVDEYVAAHAAVWPAVLQTISDCHIHNYSIFLHGDTLFAYFEYAGDDFAADMARMAEDPQTQAWWAWMQPMQQPVSGAADDEWWVTMPEVFHHD